jgi:hypothetical protein
MLVIIYKRITHGIVYCQSTWTTVLPPRRIATQSVDNTFLSADANTTLYESIFYSSPSLQKYLPVLVKKKIDKSPSSNTNTTSSLRDV